jgi:hypothetical protein
MTMPGASQTKPAAQGYGETCPVLGQTKPTEQEKQKDIPVWLEKVPIGHWIG